MGSKQYFDEIANQWDKMRSNFFSEVVREKAFAIANIQSGEIAVDVGAGTGFVTEGLVHHGLQVIAVDQSEVMLAEMKQKFANIEGVEYRLGTADALPIPDKTADFAFANMYLHHIEVPLIAIKEMVRILKLGGKLIITDLDEHTFEFLRTEQHDHWLGFKRNEVAQWLEEAGLKSVMVDCAGESCCSPSKSGNEYANISIFVAFGQK